MANELIPGSFFRFPRFPSFFDDEDFLHAFRGADSGLSVSEDDNHVYVEAAVPGVNPEDIEVTYDKGMLWIKGEAREEEKNKKYYRHAARSFSYRFAVPGNIEETSEPDAFCKNGVMKVTFAKRTEAQPRKITVKKE